MLSSCCEIFTVTFYYNIFVPPIKTRINNEIIKKLFCLVEYIYKTISEICHHECNFEFGRQVNNNFLYKSAILGLVCHMK